MPPASDDDSDEDEDDEGDDVVAAAPCEAPFVWVARLALVERAVLLRAGDDRLAAPVVPAVPRFAAPRFVAAPPRLAALPCLAVAARLAVPVLRLAALVPRLAAPRFAAVLRLAVPRFAAPLLAAPLFAVLRFAAPRFVALAEPALRARDVDLRAPEAAPPFFAAERRVVEALFAPARPADARLLLLPDVERLRALEARFAPVLLFERPLDRLPLLLALLRDDFVAMCGLLRGGCAANVASSAHGPQLSFWIARA